MDHPCVNATAYRCLLLYRMTPVENHYGVITRSHNCGTRDRTTYTYTMHHDTTISTVGQCGSFADFPSFWAPAPPGLDSAVGRQHERVPRVAVVMRPSLNPELYVCFLDRGRPVSLPIINSNCLAKHCYTPHVYSVVCVIGWVGTYYTGMRGVPRGFSIDIAEHV